MASPTRISRCELLGPHGDGGNRIFMAGRRGMALDGGNAGLGEDVAASDMVGSTGSLGS